MFVFVVGFLTQTELTAPISAWFESALRVSAAQDIGVAGFYWESQNIETLLQSDTKPLQKKIHAGWKDAKKEVGVAAKRLRTCIEELSKNYRVSLVAHSLGCRVVSEMLKLSKVSLVENIVFMAAACGQGHIDRGRFERAVRSRKINIFSRSDIVLSRVYPVVESGVTLERGLALKKAFQYVVKVLEQDSAIGYVGGGQKFGMEEFNAETLLGIEVGHMTYAKMVDKLLEDLFFKK